MDLDKNYLSPNNAFWVLVEPLVLKAAFLFVPERAFLCFLIVFTFLVFEATLYLFDMCQNYED